VLSPGQAHDSPFLKVLLGHLKVNRAGQGRPRTRPDALLADKAYSSRSNRAMLSARGIKVVIPERDDQKANRRRRGTAGGRPYDFDAPAYRGRNVVERSFSDHKQWRAIATRYDKHATNYRGALVLRAITIWLRE
jgi:transposase